MASDVYVFIFVYVFYSISLFRLTVCLLILGPRTVTMHLL